MAVATELACCSFANINIPAGPVFASCCHSIQCMQLEPMGCAVCRVYDLLMGAGWLPAGLTVANPPDSSVPSAVNLDN